MDKSSVELTVFFAFGGEDGFTTGKIPMPSLVVLVVLVPGTLPALLFWSR